MIVEGQYSPPKNEDTLKIDVIEDLVMPNHHTHGKGIKQ